MNLGHFPVADYRYRSLRLSLGDKDDDIVLIVIQVPD